MNDDYFSDDAIQARVKSKMRRYQRLFAHVAIMIAVIFIVSWLMVVKAISVPLLIAIIFVMILSMIAHGLGLGLTEMREEFLNEEMEKAGHKRKVEHLELGEDGELHTIDGESVVFEDDSARR